MLKPKVAAKKPAKPASRSTGKTSKKRSAA
jgi:hypothetical protein